MESSGGSNVDFIQFFLEVFFSFPPPFFLRGLQAKESSQSGSSAARTQKLHLSLSKCKVRTYWIGLNDEIWPFVTVTWLGPKDRWQKHAIWFSFVHTDHHPESSIWTKLARNSSYGTYPRRTNMHVRPTRDILKKNERRKKPWCNCIVHMYIRVWDVRCREYICTLYT